MYFLLAHSVVVTEIYTVATGARNQLSIEKNWLYIGSVGECDCRTWGVVFIAYKFNIGSQGSDLSIALGDCQEFNLKELLLLFVAVRPRSRT